MSVEWIYQRVKQVRDSFQEARTFVSTQHPAWDADRDVRVMVFAHAVSVGVNTMLGIHFLERQVRHPAWLASSLDRPVSAAEAAEAARELELHLRLAFLQITFAVAEAGIRAMVRAAYPGRCGDGNATYKSVYNFLLNQAGQTRWEESLDLYRNLRNAIHNNGVFFPDKNGDASVMYQGHRFDFRVGRPIPFATWPLVAQLASDLGSMLVDIVSSAGVSSPALILDPSIMPSTP